MTMISANSRPPATGLLPCTWTPAASAITFESAISSASSAESRSASGRSSGASGCSPARMRSSRSRERE
jgi:hypothetical protein